MIVRSYNPIERGLPAIWIDEPIGPAARVLRLARELRELPGDGPIDLVISCDGGACHAGLQMFVLLQQDPRPKRVTIFRAGSMAAVLAMAGDRRRIVEDGSIFLHGAGCDAGTLLNEATTKHLAATTLRSLARQCDATDALHAEIIGRRTGLASHVVAQLRADETTLDAAEAMRLGFVHEIVEGAAP